MLVLSHPHASDLAYQTDSYHRCCFHGASQEHGWSAPTEGPQDHRRRWKRRRELIKGTERL